ncbi:eukaryotic translation initiation factor 3 subunit H [Aureobasidium pullulans EXF-150]|uniref:Eukaryotic translation initiation factor 3 subunit H n=1 Tax=Aureobasidium pullulans EXF-150 TaxID=1043002 RepID=A0A074XFW3_AURPU|nr:eukaryotic translation initiation factor 3 subunit H [Aureobasidium pullulans EXF-150]KEQ84293.1 eukaryotic translation initiation factor 3 subunit H [Aureobasidium pullulans EXF-150]
MAETAVNETTLREVRVDALVVMRIIKHSSQVFPSIVTGSLVGLDIEGQLQVTNSFNMPQVDGGATVGDANDAQLAAQIAAPRAKANIAYQSEMIRMLREVNVDAQSVGWYMSASMGNFVSLAAIENQFYYQKEANERTITLVHDVSRSSQGSLNLRAYRLSPQFIAAYKEGKFTTESLQKSGLRYQDIFTELPVVVYNSHLLTSFLHQLPTPPPSKALNFPPSLATLEQDPSLTSLPLAPNFDSLDLSIDPFLEKTCDLLLDSIETHHTELNNYQFYQRSLAREQAKITQWQTKRKAENASRTATKQPLLPEDEWQKLFKLPQEPSRLETLVNSRQVEQYARQVDAFTASISAKMFAVKSNLVPSDD